MADRDYTYLSRHWLKNNMNWFAWIILALRGSVTTSICGCRVTITQGRRFTMVEGDFRPLEKLAYKELVADKLVPTHSR
jgi:hypothetical protein